AFTGFLGALEESETAPKADADKVHKTLTTAASSVESTFADMVANSFDPAASNKVTDKKDKALIAAAQATLKGLPATFNGAVTTASASAAPKKEEPKKDAAAGAGKPPKK